MWASPMLVMTATVGRTILPQIADLAEVIHARLDDRRLMLRHQRSRVCGVPISLL